MAHHAKSFYWASHFLSPIRFSRVARLYAFCRHVDDSVDLTTPEEGRRQLDLIGQEMQGLAPARAEVALMLELMEELDIPLDWPMQLWQGADFDLSGQSIETDADLLVYCYRVAGVVGLLMCPLLGVHNPKAWPFAIDLGMAMQLTNICRDVGEDAERGRNYIPARRWRRPAGEPPPQAGELVLELLDRADSYYESSRRGYSFIPWRERLAISVAARVYRGIGVKIRKDPGQVMHRRVYLSKGEKLYWTLIGLKDFVFSFSNHFVPHQQEQHQALRGLPGVSS